MNVGDACSDIISIMNKVFSEMVSTDLDGQTRGAQIKKDQDDLVAMVGFAGAITGLISVHCSIATAKVIASKMLATDINYLNQEDSRDAIAEVTNIIAGSYKAQYAERNHNGELVLEQTIPTVISGDSFETFVVGETRNYSVVFDFEKNKIEVELWIKLN